MAPLFSICIIVVIRKAETFMLGKSRHPISIIIFWSSTINTSLFLI